MFFTAFFVTVIMHVKYSKLGVTTDGALGCAIVGIAIFTTISMSARLTSACLNPWVGLSVVPFQTLADTNYINYIWAYTIGPVLGGCAAAVLTKLSYIVYERKEEQDQKFAKQSKENRNVVNDDYSDMTPQSNLLREDQ